LVERIVGIRETEDGTTISAATVAEVDAAIEDALDDESLQALNQQTVQEMMGPDWQPPANTHNSGSVLGPTIPS
jgi:hypothetical protein